MSDKVRQALGQPLAGVRRRIAADEDDPAKPKILKVPGVQVLRPSINACESA